MRSTTVVGGAERAVDEGDDGAGDGGGAGGVEPAPGRRGRSSSRTRRARTMAATETGTVTRNTDDQPKVPARSPPARTRRSLRRGPRRRPRALIARARARPGKCQQQQRHGGRAERGGAGALDDAAGDQHPSLPAAPASSVPAVNSRGAGDEHAPAAEEVGGAAGEQQQAAEGEHVGVDHPGESGRRRAPRSAWMEGSATLTMEVSSMTMNCAETSSPKAMLRRRRSN